MKSPQQTPHYFRLEDVRNRMSDPTSALSVPSSSCCRNCCGHDKEKNNAAKKCHQQQQQQQPLRRWTSSFLLLHRQNLCGGCRPPGPRRRWQCRCRQMSSAGRDSAVSVQDTGARHPSQVRSVRTKRVFVTLLSSLLCFWTWLRRKRNFFTN